MLHRIIRLLCISAAVIAWSASCFAQGGVLAVAPVPCPTPSGVKACVYQAAFIGGNDPAFTAQGVNYWYITGNTLVVHAETAGLCAVVHPEFQSGCDFTGQFITTISTDPPIKRRNIGPYVHIAYGTVVGDFSFTDQAGALHYYPNETAVFAVQAYQDAVNDATGGGGLTVETP